MKINRRGFFAGLIGMGFVKNPAEDVASYSDGKFNFYTLKQLGSSLDSHIAAYFKTLPVGDGVTDDTAAIQHMIDNAQEIHLPKGRWRMVRTSGPAVSTGTINLS